MHSLFSRLSCWCNTSTTPHWWTEYYPFGHVVKKKSDTDTVKLHHSRFQHYLSLIIPNSVVQRVHGNDLSSWHTTTFETSKLLVILNCSIHPKAAAAGQRRGLFPQLEPHILSFMCEYLHMDVHSHTGHLAPVCEASRAFTHTLQIWRRSWFISIYGCSWVCIDPWLW